MSAFSSASTSSSTAVAIPPTSERAYLDSSKELQNAINSLEASLVSFVGTPDAKAIVHGQLFTKTRQRLQAELAARSARDESNR